MCVAFGACFEGSMIKFYNSKLYKSHFLSLIVLPLLLDLAMIFYRVIALISENIVLSWDIEGRFYYLTINICFSYLMFTIKRNIYRKVQVGKDQEKAQSEKEEGRDNIHK